MPDKATTVCFIDTNIWLYAFIDGNDPAKSATARKLIQETQPVISTQVINEVCVNLLKKAKFSEEQISQLVESFFEKYPVIELSKSLFLAASKLRQQYSLSYWGSLIVAGALQAGVSILYSEDMHHGLKINGQLQLLNPFIG